MKHIRRLLLPLLIGAAAACISTAGGATIHVNDYNSVVLHAGDELDYVISVYAFLRNFGMLPAGTMATPITAFEPPPGAGADLRISIASLDTDAEMVFPSLEIAPGVRDVFERPPLAIWQIISAPLYPTAEDWAAVLGGLRGLTARLRIRNAGADVWFGGLPGYTLNNGEGVLALDGTRIGADGAVEEFGASAPWGDITLVTADQVPAPEPGTWAMLVGAVALLLTARSAAASARRPPRPSA